MSKETTQSDTPAPQHHMEPSTAFAEWLNSGPDIAKAAGIEVEIVAITSEGNMLKLTSAGFPENTPTEITGRLSMFLDALDEWGCSSNDERAKEIMKFLSSGADLSNYEEKP